MESHKNYDGKNGEVDVKSKGWRKLRVDHKIYEPGRKFYDQQS